MAKKAVKVLHRKFRSYSGPVIKGVGDPVPPPMGPRMLHHVDRAFWLTTMVETGGRFGAVMMADGTACTIGLDQHIAVYPKELANEDFNAADDQGTLWKLLRRLETVRSSPSYHQALEVLWGMFAEQGWYVAQDGVLRYASDRASLGLGTGKHAASAVAGDIVFGQHIRNTLTPSGGKVPKSGKEWELAKRWAKAFHALTSHPGGQAAQVEYGIEHLVKRTKRRRIKVPGSARWVDLEILGYGGREVTSLRVGDGDWSEELDLAMCVYQSHSVNAPSIANKMLARARNKAQGGAAVGNQARLAKWLIRFLGNSTYGRWDDDIKHGRYQRTRAAARASGLWTRSLFDGANAIMPRDLPG